MKTVSHLFMPGDTILAVLKKHNGYTQDLERLEFLTKIFHDINGYEVFHPGMRVEIPVMFEPEND